MPATPAHAQASIGPRPAPCCAPPTTDAARQAAAPRTPGVGSPYVIRSATPADLPRVRELLAGAGLPASDVDAQFGEQYAVAVSDAGEVIGAEGIEVYGAAPAYGLLRSAVVAESWRGRGVGEALTRDRLAWAHRRGIAEVYLLTATAEGFFPRFGFEVVERAAAPAALQRSSEFASLCPSTATTMRLVLDAPRAISDMRSAIRQTYGAAATRASQGARASCGSACCGTGAPGEAWDPITSDLYERGETQGIPAEALLASLGCGNPTALAELTAGEVVLDLGSGGGIDVLLSARRVGPTGKAYGLDMTDEMLALARENQRRAGATNVEFLKGEIESVPLPDASVDVIISNCVINLSADKRRVLAEAFRVLKPGGRFAVSDIVIRGALPPDVRRSMELWVGCVAGALEEGEFRRLLAEVGFEDVDIEPTRVYGTDDAHGFLSAAGPDAQALAAQLDGRIMSAFVRGRKPASRGVGGEGE